jgi:hypothetical protein
MPSGPAWNAFCKAAADISAPHDPGSVDRVWQRIPSGFARMLFKVSKVGLENSHLVTSLPLSDLTRLRESARVVRRLAEDADTALAAAIRASRAKGGLL